MNQEQIYERLHVMRLQEDSTYTCTDYLLSRPITNQQQQGTTAVDTIDHVCRYKMTEWCYTVIDYIKFRRETVSIAMNYLDRFLSSNCPKAQEVFRSRRLYQLASMTTLFMAIKINEPVVVDINLMTDLSKGVYKQEDFQKMETDILFGLNWYVNGPTAHSFAVHLLTLLMQEQQMQDQKNNLMGVVGGIGGIGGVAPPTSKKSSSINYKDLLQLASYKIELAMGEYKLMTQKPSVIATASIWSCIEDLTNNNDPMLRKNFYTLASNFSIPMDCLQETKECIQQAKLGRSMQMRLIDTSLLEVQSASSSATAAPRTNAPSPTSVSQAVRCTKNDPEHCSPICISRRNVVSNHH